VAASVFASWFVDCLPAPPRLAIFGRSPQSTQLFTLLSCLFRRAVRLSELTLAGLCSLPIEAQPALFLDDCELDARTQKAISSRSAGGYFPWNGRLLNLSCATVIRSSGVSGHELLGAGALEIPIEDGESPLRVLSPQELREIGKTFQAKLLMYRLRNYRRVADFGGNFPDLQPVLQSRARLLLPCLPVDCDASTKLVSFLEEWNQEPLEDVPTNLGSFVIEALWTISHRKNAHSAHVGTITREVNALLEQRGELFELRPRAVGHLLKALSFQSKRLDAAGRGVLFNRPVREQIHKLAAAYKISLETKDGVNCEYCEPVKEGAPHPAPNVGANGSK
jgi:hypothetical protein